ncbi:MAG: non-ribosomal peptide synthetase, partial [Pyrinomonadaceae bacterium]|nr:non-ribosomal peptide synthetase [Pyrinomonadaceae bacterium]
QRLLEQIVQDPHQHLHQLSLLTDSQRAELLFDWNQRAEEYPQESPIHHLFAQQVARSPHALALSYADRHLSYQELNRRANQLAHHLRSLGIMAGSHVAICLDHSPETVVSILGVLKAGAAYLPLDPLHPPARLAFMIEDAKASLLLTQQHLTERFSTADVPLLSIDSQWDVIAQQSTEELPKTTTTAESAYLIYTSGSTGEPKAVMISHQSLVNYICWAADVYLREESLSTALYSSLAFDLTVTSIFVPLISGNTIFVYKAEGGVPPLLEIMEENLVGVLKLTPSHLSLLKERDNRESRVKRLIVGGEALTTTLAREVSESFGGKVEIYNEYGPTEATVGCMIYRFDAESDVRVSVPIGVPAANTTIYVLDERMEPVGENVPAEIYIGGDGLAIGYLNRAELTAERFVPHPFSQDAGARLYRTGDVGRRLRGGRLEYIGRRDEQVKYHGYRVELGEISSHLNSHPSVRDSVVRILRDQRGAEQMVAYYVSRQEISSEQLRQHLAERLMREVVPQLYVHLRRMPLTLNGKVNVEGLPGLEEARGQVKVRGEGVRTAVEEGVRGVWEEVLGVVGVGVEDNFFELGGHSLLATQVLVRVREVFGVEVGLRRLFEEPTVAGLSEVVEEMLRTGLGQEVA